MPHDSAGMFIMRLAYILRNGYLSLLGKKTVGVRLLLLNESKVLLVKHTYQQGWYTVGGGVDRNETPRQALERELLEEVGVTLNAPPTLFSVYYSHREKHDDYVIFYIGHLGSQEPVRSPEIAEQQWFDLNQLPPEVSPATARRIAEYLGQRPMSELW